MLISRERNRYAPIDYHKVKDGRFLTRGSSWLLPQVRNFILSAKPEVVCDPFAGACHMLRAVSRLVPQTPLIAYDILPLSDIRHNDSLIDIPASPDMLIVSNPPFLAKHSARRKRVYSEVEHYFELNSKYTDLYQIALDRMLSVADRVVAILPETFINAGLFRKHLQELTVLEHNPFTDTDCPVVVACFGPDSRATTPVYRDSARIGELDVLEAVRLRPHNHHPIRFNVKNGLIGLQAVDTHDPKRPIRFMPRAMLGYRQSGIKVSSRLVTYISVPHLKSSEIEEVCRAANKRLDDLRARSQDIILSPFKGNRSDGRRRRRLDYSTARAILEEAIDDVSTPSTLWNNQ